MKQRKQKSKQEQEGLESPDESAASLPHRPAKLQDPLNGQESRFNTLRRRMEEGGRGKYPRPKYHAGKISTCATHLGVNRFNAVPGATYISMIMLKLTGFAAHLAGIEVGDLPFSYRLPNPKAAAQGGRGCDPEKHLRQCETGLTQGGGGHRTTSLLTPGASESSLSQRKMLLEGPARERTNWETVQLDSYINGVGLNEMDADEAYEVNDLREADMVEQSHRF
ncbi:hypothetical protein MMC16_006231 [Acarospora aff. strigata]|nr:hypothetical protein [Acarospora aff. strigata]